MFKDVAFLLHICDRLLTSAQDTLTTPQFISFCLRKSIFDVSPHVLYWFKVWGLGRPLHSNPNISNIVLLKYAISSLD